MAPLGRGYRARSRFKRSGYAPYFLILEVRVHRQRELLLSPGLGPWHVCPDEATIEPDGMAMDGRRVVNARFDAALFQCGRDLLAAARSYREKMEDTVSVGLLLEHLNRVGEELAVQGGAFAASAVPLVEMSKLDAQHRCLQAVKSRVVAQLAARPLLTLS